MPFGSVSPSEAHILRDKIIDCAHEVTEAFEERGDCYTPLLAMIDYCLCLKRLELQRSLELEGIFP